MLLEGPKNDLLLRLLSAADSRARMLANNISNQNTPGYKRQELEFEDLLIAELRRPEPNLHRVEPQLVEDADAIARADGNNVSMEEELGRMRENRIMYELYTSILRGRMNLIRSAIHGDR